MTEEQFLEKFDSLLPKVVEGLKGRARAAVKVGALDLESSKDDSFWLPKATLCAALQSEINQWRPLGGQTADERNLLHYI